MGRAAVLGKHYKEDRRRIPGDRVIFNLPGNVLYHRLLNAKDLPPRDRSFVSSTSALTH
jgi:hypothetical protein